MITASLQQLDKRHLWHPFTPMSVWLDSDPLVITEAEGFYLIDSNGDRYLDGVSSLWCNVHGHRVPEIDTAIKAQLGKVAHTTMLGLASEPAILLAEKLVKIVPSNLTKVFYSDAGATATEIAFKLAAQYWFNTGHPDKHEFIAFTNAYHGDTIGAMSIGRMPAFHKPYLPLLFKVHYASTPTAKTWSLEEIETLLLRNKGKIAAICIEPIVQGAGGVLVQPPGFLTAVRKLATQYDTLLICDEVATGFAKTGKMFAVEHDGVRPDLMTIAKGLTGGYLPLAATLATEQIFDAFLGHPSENRTFFHGHTFTGNPLGCAAAIANLDLMEKNQTVEHVATTAPQLAAKLGRLQELPNVGAIRQKGFMIGIDVVRNRETGETFEPADRTGHAVCNRLRRRGVILRPLGDTIVFMPAPAMPWRLLETIVEALFEELAALGGR